MKTSSKSTPPRSGLPLKEQLYVVLRDQILRGLYAPGDLIPSEGRLGELFGVSRITVRKAMADLEAEGLIDKQQGRGTYVRQRLPAQRPAATLGFLDSLRKQAQNTKVQVLDFGIADPPPAVALQLQLARGERAVHAVRLRSVQGTPMMVTDAWIPEHLGKSITRARLNRQALYEILMARGVQFGRVVQDITAAPADPHRAGLLDVAVGSPLMQMQRLLYGIDRHPVQFMTVHFSPARSRILMDVDIASVNTLSAGQITHDALVR